MSLLKKLFLKFFTGNRLQSGNRLYDSKLKFKILFKPFVSKLSSDNRLHCLVIDYQSLGCWKQCVLRQKLDQPMRLFEALSFSWFCLIWPWIILEAMLNLWMLVETTLLFDSTLTSSKSSIYTFTFSSFLMTTITIKQTLLSIFKTCMTHILPFFYDNNQCQVNSFRHHQNLKSAWLA